MNYNLRDLSLIILLVILITITCSINMNEYLAYFFPLKMVKGLLLDPSYFLKVEFCS